MWPSQPEGAINKAICPTPIFKCLNDSNLNRAATKKRINQRLLLLLLSHIAKQRGNASFGFVGNVLFPLCQSGGFFSFSGPKKLAYVPTFREYVFADLQKTYSIHLTLAFIFVAMQLGFLDSQKRKQSLTKYAYIPHIFAISMQFQATCKYVFACTRS